MGPHRAMTNSSVWVEEICSDVVPLKVTDRVTALAGRGGCEDRWFEDVAMDQISFKNSFLEVSVGLLALSPGIPVLRFPYPHC